MRFRSIAAYPRSLGDPQIRSQFSADAVDLAAYVSPNSGKALGVITDYGATMCYAGGTPQYLALLDLAGILAAPRSGAHTIADASAFVTFVATH